MSVDKLEVFRRGHTLAAHGATWTFKPPGESGSLKEDYIDAYKKNPIKAERDLGAVPPQAAQSALHDVGAVERLFNRDRISPVKEDGGFHDWFKGDPKAEYFLHIDMSKAKDATGMGMCHYDVLSDKVVVDLIHTIDKTREWSLSFERIKHLIFALRDQMKFNLVKVTFDSWQSYMMLESLINAGVPAELYSVDRGTEAYDTLIETLLSGKLDYYYQARFIKEMKELRLVKGNKYDHPLTEGGSKDTSDGVAGCVSNCVKARMGLAMPDVIVEKAVHPEHNLHITEQVTESGKTVYVMPDGILENITIERQRRRLMRVDVVRDMLITVLGWHDKPQDRLYVDEYLVWPELDQEVIVAFQRLVTKLMLQVKIEGFSLNEYVPIDLIEFLQHTGKPVTSPLAIRTPNQHSNLAKSGTLTAASLRLTVEQIRKGDLTIPYVLSLVKDLKFSTIDNLQDRVFLAALAGWSDFVTREFSFGRTGHHLPSIKPSQAAPTNIAIRTQISQGSSGAVQAKPGRGDIDSIRAKYSSVLSRTNKPVRPLNQGQGLPRIRKG